MILLTGIQWVPEEKITLFTADGLIQIGGSMVPKRIPSADVCSFLFVLFCFVS